MHRLFILPLSDIALTPFSNDILKGVSTVTDTAGGWNNTTGMYTIPQTGVWTFNFSVYRSNDASLMKLAIYLTKLNNTLECFNGDFTSNDRSLQYTITHHFT